MLTSTREHAVHELPPSKRAAFREMQRRDEERNFVYLIASPGRRARRKAYGMGDAEAAYGEGAHDASPRPCPRGRSNVPGQTSLIARPLQELANMFPFLAADLVHVSGHLPAHAVLDPLDGVRVTREELAAEARRQAYSLLEPYMRDRAALHRLRTDVQLLAFCRARLHASTRPRSLLNHIRTHRRAMRDEQARAAAERLLGAGTIAPILRRALRRYIWRYRERKAAERAPKPPAPAATSSSGAATAARRTQGHGFRAQRNSPHSDAAAQIPAPSVRGRQRVRRPAAPVLPPLPPVAQGLATAGGMARMAATKAAVSRPSQPPRICSLREYLERGIEELSGGLQDRIRARAVAAMLRGRPTLSQARVSGRPNLVLYDERLVQRVRRRGAVGEFELEG